MTDFLPILFDGTAVTVKVAAVSMLLATAMAIIAGLARLSKSGIVRGVTVAYVEFFRGTSLLVQLFWLFFVLPHFGVYLEPYFVGVLAIGLNGGAYGSEIVRGAILAVPRAQHEAAIALNMSPRLRMRRIILPQAALLMLWPWGNLLIELLKSTALVSLITLQDLTFKVYNLNIQTFRTWELFTLSLIFYFIMAQILVAGVTILERRMSRGIARGHL